MVGSRAEQVVAWTRIENKQDASGIAALVMALPRTNFSGGNSLGAAFDGGMRRVIDISGDGPNNRATGRKMLAHAWWPEA